MFKTLSTLIVGANSRAEDRVRDAFAIELIDQKIREADASLKAAKATLATLVQRQRSEARLKSTLSSRIGDLTARAQAALDAGDEALAREAATQIATMENERTIREETLARLDARTLRLRATIEAGHRRIIDLRQGAIQARAVRREQQIQTRLNTTIGRPASADEAEELINRVLGRDDPFEQAEILREIDADLNGTNLTDRMADAGFGAATRATTQSVLDGLKSN